MSEKFSQIRIHPAPRPAANSQTEPCRPAQTLTHRQAGGSHLRTEDRVVNLADSAFYKASRQRLREAFATAQPAPEHDRVELSPCGRFSLQLLLEVDPVQS
ncbi:MAG: hypothetical protein AB7S38_09985 [Vulcanimicrobiota bacterium]